MKGNIFFNALRCKLNSTKCWQRSVQHIAARQQYYSNEICTRELKHLRSHHCALGQQLISVKCISSKYKFSTTNEVIVRVIKQHERQKVLNFLRLHYYLEEPLTAGSEPKQQDKEDEDWILSHIHHNMSFMAISNRKKFVGVLISGPKRPHEAEQLFEEAAKLGPTKFGHILQFSACVEREANVCERFNVHKVVHIHVLAVDVGMRGKTIGHRLVEELLLQAKYLNFEVATVDCTSFYSARLFERMGFQCINIKYYKDYLDGTGKQVFIPDAPHECVKTFALKLKTS